MAVEMTHHHCTWCGRTVQVHRDVKAVLCGQCVRNGSPGRIAMRFAASISPLLCKLLRRHGEPPQGDLYLIQNPTSGLHLSVVLVESTPSTPSVMKE